MLQIPPRPDLKPRISILASECMREEIQRLHGTNYNVCTLSKAICATGHYSPFCSEVDSDVTIALLGPGDTQSANETLHLMRKIETCRSSLKIGITLGDFRNVHATTNDDTLTAARKSFDADIFIGNKQLIYADHFFEMERPSTDAMMLLTLNTIIELMTGNSLIGVDFADCLNALGRKGCSATGFGEAHSRDKARAAAKNAILSLRDYTDATASGLVVNIAGGDDMTLDDVVLAAETVAEQVAAENASITFCSTYDQSMSGGIRVSIIAAGLSE